MLLAEHNLEDFLGNVLRGVSKIVGCNSTNLVVINESAREMRVRIGATANDYPVLAELESVLGQSFQGLSVPLETAADGLIGQVWRDGGLRETSSLASLVGSAIPQAIIEQFEQRAGDRRILVAPTMGARRRYGVLLFEKPGRRPYTRQQREVLLRYARRIGEILEDDVMGERARLAPDGAAELGGVLLDETGRLAGNTSGDGQLGAAVAQQLGEQVQAWLTAGAAAPAPAVVLADGRHISCQAFSLAGRQAALCRVAPAPDSGTASLETQLLQLTLGAPAPALFLDPDGSVTSTNRAAESLFGRPDGDLIGQPVDGLVWEPAELSRRLAEQTLTPGAPAAELKATIRRPEGSLRPVRIEALLLADDRDRAIGYLVLLRPRGPESEAPGPEQLVDQERLATMGEMAAQLAHEIRSPLVAIGATLDNLSRRQDDARQQGTLAAVGREINRMDMILRKYLAARDDVVFAETPLDALLAEVRRLLEGAWHEADKHITLETAPGSSVHGDHDTLKHVFFNLVLNALEASPAGGTVELRSERGDGTVTVWIADRGPGLSVPADQCLQPFFTTKSNGSGLGLPVCAKLIRSHGGLLELDNRPGGGCCVRVVLPASRPGGDGG